jgi:hypothetical protein
METLNLFKDRHPYEIITELKGKKKTFKIPNELTIEESERLLEAEIQIMSLSKQEIGDKKDEEEKIKQYFNNLYQYLLVLFNRYQPEITLSDLKGMMSQAEAIRILEFFKSKRFLHLIGADEEPDLKKKSLKPHLDN